MNATDPTDSQSIERTPDPSASKLSATQTTKLEKQILAILNTTQPKANPFETPAQTVLRERHKMTVEHLAKDITALIQSEASRIAEEALVAQCDDMLTRSWFAYPKSVPKFFVLACKEAAKERLASLTAPEGQTSQLSEKPGVRSNTNQEDGGR